MHLKLKSFTVQWTLTMPILWNFQLCSHRTMSILYRQTGKLFPIASWGFANVLQNPACQHESKAMPEHGAIMHTSQQSVVGWLEAPVHRSAIFQVLYFQHPSFNKRNEEDMLHSRGATGNRERLLSLRSFVPRYDTFECVGWARWALNRLCRATSWNSDYV